MHAHSLLYFRLQTSPSPSPLPPQIFSDEDDLTYPQVLSSSSSGSGDSELANNSGNFESSKAGRSRSKKSGSSEKNSFFASSNNSSNNPPKVPQGMPLPSQNRMYNNNLPIVYAPHSTTAIHSQNINHFPCKYPGCNQVSLPLLFLCVYTCV